MLKTRCSSADRFDTLAPSESRAYSSYAPKRLLELGELCIVSVPFQWHPEDCHTHIHDPVGKKKMADWSETEPAFEMVIPELNGKKRLIQVYGGGLPPIRRAVEKKDSSHKPIKKKKNRLVQRYKRFKRNARRSGVINMLRFQWGKAPTMEVRYGDLKVKIRRGTPDLKVVGGSLQDEFEPLRGRLSRDFNGLIVDAGGYIGSAAIKLSSMFPEATVVSIEPSSENYSLLVENTESNPHIIPLNAALVATPQGPLPLSNRETGQWGFTIVESPLDKPNARVIEQVETITLAQIRERFDSRPIGILKLDIEGGEKDLLENASGSLDEIPLILAELHERIVKGTEKAFKKFSEGRDVSSYGGEKWLSQRID